MGGSVVCFNPTLVRLRLSARTSSGWLIFRFQSHAGSIEAGGRRRLDGPQDLGFNPTLVRLRRDVMFTDMGTVRLFQSHAGSIEASMF